MRPHIHATAEAGKIFYQHFHNKGKIVMINLLKFRQTADYTDLEQLKPSAPIDGEAAYQLYMTNTLPLLKNAGSRVVYYGRCKDFLIGPKSEKWDAILIVEHQSVSKFMAFAQNKDYLEHAGHRAAALEDSRLLPSIEQNEPLL